MQNKKLIEDLKIRAGYGHKPVTMSFDEFKKLVRAAETEPKAVVCTKCYERTHDAEDC